MGPLRKGGGFLPLCLPYSPLEGPTWPTTREWGTILYFFGGLKRNKKHWEVQGKMEYGSPWVVVMIAENHFMSKVKLLISAAHTCLSWHLALSQWLANKMHVTSFGEPTTTTMYYLQKPAISSEKVWKTRPELGVILGSCLQIWHYRQSGQHI